MTLTIFTALFALSGCPGSSGKCDTGDSAGNCDSGTPADVDTDTDTDTDTDADLSFGVSWSGDGVTLSITNGGSATYLFGLAELTSEGWLGEDGYAGPAGSGHGGDFDINHDSVSSSGITLTTVHDFDAVVANSTTLITDTIHEAGHVAYMLTDGVSCWEQNDDSAMNYYECM